VKAGQGRQDVGVSASPSPAASPIIAARLLAALLPEREPPVVLDVRWRLGGPPGRADYDAAHIPGAVFVDLDAELAGPPGPQGRHPLPDPDRLQTVLRGAGVSSGSQVVAYDDGNCSVAARAWWLLRWAGLPAQQVAVLDGGWAGWVADGLPTTAAPSRPGAGDVVVRAGAMPVLDAEAAAALAGAGVLLDARAAPRYRGEVEPVDPRAGHIPGARNLPATDIVGPDGRVLPAADLARRFAELGATGDAQVGAYCGSGVTASALVLAAEHAGLRTAKHPIALYAGSWSNWSSDPARAVATGVDP
jgi:thiosulfate/3-mercaptopyruvate sulfurtransferase